MRSVLSPLLEADGAASPARVHDFLLGGHHHLSADREMADLLLLADPRARTAAQIDHRHRELALTYLAAQHGIRQVLVIGCGYPRRPYVHQVVGRYGPPRVVYADTDLVALEHARAAGRVPAPGRVGFVRAGVAEPAALAGVQAREVLDFTRPVAVLLHHTLHLTPDPTTPLTALKAMLAGGSALSITHPTGDLHPRHVTAAAAATAAGMPVRLRTRQEVEAFCEGWHLSKGGVMPTASWGHGRRSAPGSGVSSAAYAVIAFKP
ncbi:SAM-dependent methyltransferase [Streptomyces sp. NPDC037389]|uniref:SAM-dependent methyltransferase n=1 Tax=Streptomyces sp. NPDC037389 TaxID=3155369 RepID=UPI0033CD764E